MIFYVVWMVVMSDFSEEEDRRTLLVLRYAELAADGGHMRSADRLAIPTRTLRIDLAVDFLVFFARPLESRR